MLGTFRCSIVAGAVIAALLAAAPAPAQDVAAVPSAANCTLPACMGSSPDGSFVSTIIVRDIANNPVAGSHLTLDFSSCGIFVPCTFPCAGCAAHTSSRTVTKTADANGVATFDLRVGGACGNERVTISADGVYLGTAAFTPLDQNGDLSVTGADLVRVQVAESTGDLSCDFDCSGTVTAADYNIANAHLGASCSGVVPTTRSTWGTIKGAYR